MSNMKILNPDVCFTLYKKEGTFQRVAEYLSSRGMVSPRTGRPFTRQAVHYILLRSRQYRDYIRRRETRYRKAAAIMLELESEMSVENNNVL